MLEINERAKGSMIPIATLTLPFDQRQKSRMRVILDNGNEAAVLLERGGVLRDRDLLRAADGQIIEVRAADEAVSTVRILNAHLISRVCYHLGNRHVPLQIGDSWLRYQKDPVLDEMVRSFGLSVQHEEAPFEPEAGAYGKQAGNHYHTHSHEY